ALPISRVELREFKIRRVSNLHGPLVRELSGGVRRLLERELQGPRLTAKINRSIDKRRDRLAFSLSDFSKSGWRTAVVDSALLGERTPD
ncbi:MAG: hypothetical protein AAF961_08885, partial [Planctomycetota bacterium]